MAKPANFPERIRQRRLGALDRLAKAVAPKFNKANRRLTQAESDAWRQKRDSEMLTLYELTADSQRDVRTKKDRSGTARAAFKRGA